MSEGRELIARGVWTLRRQGPRALARKTAGTVARRWDSAPDLWVEPELIADSGSLQLSEPDLPVAAGHQLTIGWVCTPPGLGSGGHITMFRMIQALERAGHRCHLYLYDRHGGDIEAQRRTVRRGWPEIRAEIHRASELPSQSGDHRLNACVATSWESAHVLARLGTAPMRRFYFVQDFEPYFYPRGSEYALAEDSYRFGFDLIALGSMVGERLGSMGLKSTVVQFGCDSLTYRLLDQDRRPREGVVCYARPGNPRRGWIMARLALTEFHQRHPEVPITVYGADVRELPFAASVLPRLTPDELNALYNASVAGLALSFTNVSLVPEEMLCAGAIPVTNDAPEPRACLTNPYVVWAPSTPTALAEALSTVVEHPDVERRADAAAASVTTSWLLSAAQLVAAVEQRCWAPAEQRQPVAAGRS